MDVTFWNRFAGLYDAFMHTPVVVERQIDAYMASFFPPDAVVLDAACGTGRFSCAFSGLVQEMVCCDYSEKMVEQTKKKVRHLQLAHVSCTVQDIMDLQFDEALFDVVLAANVLHLLEKPLSAVEELERVTKPGGVLMFPTYITKQWKPIGSFLLKGIQVLGFKPAHTWSVDEYLQFLTATGLELMDYTTIESTRCMCIAVLKKKEER